MRTIDFKVAEAIRKGRNFTRIGTGQTTRARIAAGKYAMRGLT